MREVLTSKKATQEFKVKTQLLVEKYHLGLKHPKPGDLEKSRKVACHYNHHSCSDDIRTPTPWFSQVLASLERELSRDDVKNQLMEARVGVRARAIQNSLCNAVLMLGGDWRW